MAPRNKQRQGGGSRNQEDSLDLIVKYKELVKALGKKSEFL